MTQGGVRKLQQQSHVETEFKHVKSSFSGTSFTMFDLSDLSICLQERSQIEELI
jgi:hypothetical protein